jgi:rare lipoprotein A
MNPAKRKFAPSLKETTMRLRMSSRWRLGPTITILSAALLAACSSTPQAPSPVADPIRSSSASVAKAPTRMTPVLPPAGSGRGGYYKDDGPGDQIPPGLEDTPDPEPKVEPYSKGASRPYAVFGQTYAPITDARPFVQRGIGSWYGKKFHGQKTSSGELYDMYKMTAAHPTLPIPSYARVTNLNNGKQVIVRINDRGPFHSSRIIDLSYTAALKLGYLGKGSGELEVERLLPEEIERIAQRKRQAPAAVATEPAIAAQAAVQPEVQPAAAMPVAADPFPLEFADSKPAADLVPAPASGYYLQLGAYSQPGNAESLRNQLAQKWASSLPPIEVVQSGLLYRLYSGPFTSRNAAADAAQLVDAGQARPIIVQR